MTAKPFLLELSHDGEPLLRVESNGLGEFTVAGARLRDPVYGVGMGAPGYTTGDDSHILGLVSQQLGALVAVEIIQRALAARTAEAAS